MRPNQLTKLPLGIQTFAKVRELGFAYVYKTPQAIDLANSASRRVYFSAQSKETMLRAIVG